MTSTNVEVVRAGRREWVGLGVLALPALLASLELTVTHLALPSIAADLHPSGSELLWIVDVYAFLLAGSLITMGTLGDRIGRRRLLLGGAALYGVASVLAAFATGPAVLIAARALMGIAGSTLMPSVIALVAAMFKNPGQRSVAIGIVVASVSGGTAIGPLVGGWLLDSFHWGAVFLIGLPVMVALLIAGPRLLPEYRAPGRKRLDLLSAALSMGAILPIVYGLKQLAADGFAWPWLIAVAGGVIVGVVFVVRQRRLADPMIDLRLFTNRVFSTASIALALAIFVLWAVNYGIAQFLQLVHGLDPLTAGLWTAPSAVGTIAGSLLAPRFARRVSPGTVIAGGLTLAAAGFAVLVATGPLALLVTGSIIISAGLAPTMALATDLIIGAAPTERAGTAAAIASTAPQLGGALGIALLGSLITITYRHQTGAADLTREALSAAPAREAFTNAFHLSATVSAALLLITAALTTRHLRTPNADQPVRR
ncbi:MFS transporter [Kribbella albertanoniae]|uniref:MFS transporter n=1 Tax=Kribbella albertanoniae TaxID=1266829 RepID=A0A4R4P2D8_9ACTN|nr:MFS transporter [Kribbella albertanoniae]TDC14112.1 MFS transporter [Kribbella albertanoniae]